MRLLLQRFSIAKSSLWIFRGSSRGTWKRTLTSVVRAAKRCSKPTAGPGHVRSREFWVADQGLGVRAWGLGVEHSQSDLKFQNSTCTLNLIAFLFPVSNSRSPT